MWQFLWCAVVAALMIAIPLQADQVGTPEASQDLGLRTGDGTIAFTRMPADAVQSAILQWLAGIGADGPTAEAVTTLWADQSLIGQSAGEDLLDRVVESFAAADPAARRFRDDVRSLVSAELSVPEGPHPDPFFSHCLRLYYARWLTQHRYFDEALTILESLSPEQSIDPAAIFFYRAVCQQALLQRQPAMDSLALLLNHTLDVPSRFRVVSEMMRAELTQQNPDGLSEAAQVMTDVQRRLDLGRSGEKVQEQETRVIALLDKLLEDLQKKQQQQQQQSGEGSGEGDQNQPGQQGATRSVIKGSAAEGTADRRELTENGAWGLLDKQAEAQARELIRQRFPSNYLDAISRYTKRIAERR